MRSPESWRGAFYRGPTDVIHRSELALLEVDPPLDVAVGVFYRSFDRVSIPGDPWNGSTTMKGIRRTQSVVGTSL